MVTRTINNGHTSTNLSIGHGNLDNELDISAGGSGVDTTLNSNGSEYVQGTAVGTMVQNGGIEYISAGGVTTDTIVSSGGQQYVYSGGKASRTSVLDGGTETVSSAGSAISSIIKSGGTLALFKGAVLTNAVFSGGTEIVGSGYTATGADVQGGGLAVLIVSSGGKVSNTTVGISGVENVSNGGTVTGTTLSSGGTENVSGGGAAIGTTAISGGIQNVGFNFSGTATGTIVDDGGFQIVSQGGQTVGTIVNNGGSAVVHYHATATSTTVNDGGYYLVSNGATAIATTVNDGGSQTVFGSASATIVSNGGVEDVESAGVTTGTTVDDGGTQYVYSRSVATATVVNLGGVQVVSSGGYTTSTTLDNGGSETIQAGGSAAGTIVMSGATETVFGSAGGTLVDSGGTVNISSGGSARATTLNASATANVYAGGSVLSTTVSGSGAQIIVSGGIGNDTTVISGGTEIISSGGAVGFTTISAGGTEIISSGGAAGVTTIAFGGTGTIFSSGLALSTTIGFGGSETISSGGTDSGATVQDSGTLTIASGGTASGATVQDGGTLTISSGGTASGAVIFPGGIENLYAGGTASSTAINFRVSENVYGTAFATSVGSQGYQNVYSGGSAIGTTFGQMALQTVYAGGIAISAMLTAESEQSLIGGTVNFTTVNNLAALEVSGGTASGTTVNNGGSAVVQGGSVLDTTVNAGGTVSVYVFGQASGTVVNSGGSLSVYDRGVASGTVLDSGTEDVSLDGSDVFTMIGSGGVQNVTVSGTVISATLTMGATQNVATHGSARYTFVSSLGQENVSGGGLVSGTSVGSGGTETVYAGGFDSQTVIFAGGVQSVYGSTLGDIVSGSGFQSVLSGGYAEGTFLVAGGAQVVSVSGKATDTVGSGGTETVWSGGFDTGTTVLAGGTATIAAGGVASFTTVSSGGTEIVSSGGSANFITVAPGGKAVVYSGGTITDIVLLLSGGSGGTIDLTYVPFTTSLTATLDSNDVLTISDPVTLQMAGDYTSEYFHLASDGAGGTNLTVSNVPCYCRGTMILTDRGELPVEDLAIGDRLVTVSGQARPIRWIGRRSYSERFAATNRDVWPVRITPHALGHSAPSRDLFVSPQHAMFLDGMLIPAIALTNGSSIVQTEPRGKVEYFHLELDTHDVILAEGAAAETFVDDDSRGIFHNAAAYHALYPDARSQPARYCAPRVEDGEALQAVRRRIAARPLRAEPEAQVREMTGRLEHVARGLIRGWARDPAQPDVPVLLTISDNGIVLGQVLADRYRADLAEAGIGRAFELTIPGGLSPFVSHVIAVRGADCGSELPGSPWVLDSDASICLVPHGDPMPPAVSSVSWSWRGNLDVVTRDLIAGWCQDEADPDQPVPLRIFDNGVEIARVLANRYRSDLEEAEIGNGRHAFEIRVPGGLSPLSRHVIHVRGEIDGADVPGTPRVIEAATCFDASMKQAIAAAVAAAGGTGEAQDVLSFLVAQTDQLLQRQAASDAQREARLMHQQFRRRWGTDAPVHHAGFQRRVLVVDECEPASGSQAILSHMRALQHLGYAVSFVAASTMTVTDALAATGITCCGLPFYASVEDVLRRQAGCFEVVYLHRASTASKYMALVRQYCPQARVLYGVADLWHARLRVEESSADAVLTHSARQAALLRHAVPAARVHVVPWDVALCPTPVPAADRFGVAFIGGFGHGPDIDAACFLVEEIMPLVWRHDPSIECLLAGSDMPKSIRRLAGPGVVTLSNGTDLAAVFDRVRLSVAPLRYGGGLNGNVLASLAAGVPCVMSSVAAEGIEWSAELASAVGDTAGRLAELILWLHGDHVACQDAGDAGIAMIRDDFNEARVAWALQDAIDGRRPEVVRERPLLAAAM